MFWTEEKLRARIRELSEYRYRDVQPFSELWFRADPTAAVGDIPRDWTDYSSIPLGYHWEGRDVYAWLKLSMTIPSQWNERQVVGRFDFGDTGRGGKSGFESLLFLNHESYQGVDLNHQEVFIPANLTGTDVRFEFQLWSGLEGGGPHTAQTHAIRRAEVGWLDEVTDDLYFTAQAALETVMVLPSTSVERSQLLTALDRAFREICWVEPGSTPFYESVHRARETLQTGLNQMNRTHSVTIHCIGHTHIDVAWLWRLRHTREKAARSFSTVLRLMEKFPEYVFLQTQPQLYDYIKSDYPEIYEGIKARVQEGRWEAGGAMWLEADCNLTSGESLVRQILLGTRFFRDEFGADCKYLWLPDVFGYSWALPQILKKSGIDTFMTTKISWNQYNRMPHDTFWWRGMDGSEVLAHFITTPADPNSPYWWYTYNGLVTPHSVGGTWDAYRDKEFNQDLLLSYGYGDGGGGVNREMLEMRRRLEDMPGLPAVKTSRADEFFTELHQRVESTDGYVHTWDGELYLEYHRGTYTSQAYNKRMNRKLELMYRETEWLSVLSAVMHKDWTLYPATSLNAGWKIILRNQFHDIIPGSSIHEVYEDSRAEYAEAQKLAMSAWSTAAEGIVGEETSAITVCNSAPWERTDYVLLPASSSVISDSPRFVDAHDEPLVAQVTFDGQWLVRVNDVPSLGLRSLEVQRDLAAEPQVDAVLGFQFGMNSLVTPFYEIEWNHAGQLTRIYDKESSREVLVPGECGNVLQVFEDKPKMYDAWDIDIFYQQKMSEVTQLESLECVEVGPLRAVVRFCWRYHESTAVQDVVLYAHSRRIDFPTRIDWHERQQLLKVAFPVTVRATEATFDIQFGNVRRPTHWNTSWDMARFETVGHQWVDLSERGYGVSLLNDCKYGHDVKDNVIRLSLIKSAIHPDTEADQGVHEFTYSLLPHRGDWLEGDTVREAWQLNNPLTYSPGRVAQPLSFLQVSAKNVMVDAVKKAEEGESVVVRVHEFSGQRGSVTLTSQLPIVSWQSCNLLEEAEGDIHHESSVTFNILPYEIRTFLIQMT